MAIRLPSSLPKLYSKNLPALPAREDLLLSESLNYGVGDAVVVVSVVVDVDASGVEVAAGAVVVVLVLSELLEVAGDGLTMVVF